MITNIGLILWIIALLIGLLGLKIDKDTRPAMLIIYMIGAIIYTIGRTIEGGN